MALTFLLHIPQVHILSECCDRTDQSACASSGKMAPLLMTYFSVLQSIPAESEITFNHILQTLRFNIFIYTHICLYVYKCIKFHQFMTNRAISDVHGHLRMYSISHAVSHRIIHDRARREFVGSFSPSLQMSFNTTEISGGGNWTPLGVFLGVSALRSSNLLLCPL